MTAQGKIRQRLELPVLAERGRSRGDSAEEYDWMNRIFGVGVGRREPSAVYYAVVEVL
jgi:hypothetical protein